TGCARVLAQCSPLSAALRPSYSRAALGRIPLKSAALPAVISLFWAWRSIPQKTPPILPTRTSLQRNQRCECSSCVRRKIGPSHASVGSFSHTNSESWRQNYCREIVLRRMAHLLRLKNSTWRSLFFASPSVLYGPPRFFPL